jgi:hypothetical protein
VNKHIPLEQLQVLITIAVDVIHAYTRGDKRMEGAVVNIQEIEERMGGKING